MMRKNTVPKSPDQPSRAKVAEFFGLPINEVNVQPQEDTFSINISTNVAAQEKFKLIAPFGNERKPGVTVPLYNFKDTLLVMWNGRKIQPC
jgi:hypothetical protein